jgi:cellulose synthase/poly-beta-1,6-N-acetylglucosamine synthase-like glycosyltransferase
MTDLSTLSTSPASPYGQLILAADKAIVTSQPRRPRPDLFVAIFVAWAATLFWFHPRLVQVLDIADGPLTWLSLGYFVVFTELAWLYGLYNVGVVIFSMIYRARQRTRSQVEITAASARPSVAILYTACNDFVSLSATSCVLQDYPDYKLYILDDSSDPESRAQIDAFARRYRPRVQVIRRPDKRGFKAGNLNYALKHHVRESYFAVVDADEILPSNFLSKLTPRIVADPSCGFIQANHRCSSYTDERLSQDMRIGVDIHWKWYQSLRNRYGFVMFLGHGAVLKRSCWVEVGGFPELVSEDLAYAIALRNAGYMGRFAEDVVCLEEFPNSVRAFRVRHMKWTRGTCELLAKTLVPLLRSRSITWVEKLDILFPTLNLPLTFFFFIFMVNSVCLPYFAVGEFRDITFALGGHEIVVPIMLMPAEIHQIYSYDFLLITVLTILAPVLCFILELWRQPIRLFRFLCHSTALYAALSPLSFLGVLGYVLTRKARFLVTGDRGATQSMVRRGTMAQRCGKFFCETHPDHPGVRGFEILVGGIFLVVALASFQIAFFGLAIAFLTLPFMHKVNWRRGPSYFLVWIPFSLILVSILVGGASMLGLQPVLFGFGFHF